MTVPDEIFDPAYVKGVFDRCSDKYIAFSHGPKATKKSIKGLLPEFPGVEAPGWNICVADAAHRDRWVMLTTDGKSNKEPDWVWVKEEGGK